ncbi:MAG TPA: efflux RND transporter periplasmic adaptor subunit [Kiritimatiellia bacterium]|nr:efflux RND transporter periplasmic adaptor subunit [Kiritimatiellia bacterium]
MKKLPWIVVLLIGLVVGYFLGGMRSGRVHDVPVADDGKETIYTCSMHPQIRQPNPGLCPICAMDLIPVGGNEGIDPGPRAIAMSPSARVLAGIETSPVRQGLAETKLRLSGTLAYDRSRGRELALLADGQIRVLHANVPGMRISVGEPIAEIYSPDVFSASRELIVAGNNTGLADAARRKLTLLGVDEQEINRIANDGQATDTFTLHSPINGIVASINGLPGGWLMKGDSLIELYDTSIIWGLLDVYEIDMGVVTTGLAVEVSVQAIPGEVFAGSITFVPAEINPMTRSIPVRVDIPNPNGKLKSGMFVRATVNARVADSALLVPATAVLQTGKRAMVYVQSPDDEAVYEGRVVALGPRAGDEYVIVDGLSVGELVVTRGAMRIDSSLQILAKPSMMSMASDGVAMRPQTHCPIAGGRIDRNDYVDYKGMRIYFCCPGCDEDFLKDPERYLSEMRAQGIEPEKSPVEGGGHEHH